MCLGLPLPGRRCLLLRRACAPCARGPCRPGWQPTHRLPAPSPPPSSPPRSCVRSLQQHGIKVLGDAVLNHRCAQHQGAGGVWNQFGGKMTWDERAIVGAPSRRPPASALGATVEAPPLRLGPALHCLSHMPISRAAPRHRSNPDPPPCPCPPSLPLQATRRSMAGAATCPAASSSPLPPTSTTPSPLSSGTCASGCAGCGSTWDSTGGGGWRGWAGQGVGQGGETAWRRPGAAAAAAAAPRAPSRPAPRPTLPAPRPRPPGARLDFVKGFHGSHVRDYLEASAPEFVVGEYWDSLAYQFDGTPAHNQDGHRQRIINWIEAAGGLATAFGEAGGWWVVGGRVAGRSWLRWRGGAQGWLGRSWRVAMRRSARRQQALPPCAASLPYCLPYPSAVVASHSRPPLPPSHPTLPTTTRHHHQGHPARRV